MKENLERRSTEKAELSRDMISGWIDEFYKDPIYINVDPSDIEVIKTYIPKNMPKDTKRPGHVLGSWFKVKGPMFNTIRTKRQSRTGSDTNNDDVVLLMYYLEEKIKAL